MSKAVEQTKQRCKARNFKHFKDRKKRVVDERENMESERISYNKIYEADYRNILREEWERQTRNRERKGFLK